jgi:hypothetical protein
MDRLDEKYSICQSYHVFHRLAVFNTSRLPYQLRFTHTTQMLYSTRMSCAVFHTPFHETLNHHTFLPRFSQYLLIRPRCTSSCVRAISQPGGVCICPEVEIRKYHSTLCKLRTLTTKYFHFPSGGQSFPVSIGPDAYGACVFYRTKDSKGYPA